MTVDCDTEMRHSQGELSAVTRSFIENSAFMKAFLRRFLRRSQDIEDVVQEAYLKAYCVEQEKAIEHPKSLLFTIAKNLAINELNKKSNQITEYIEECKAAMVPESVATLENELEAEQSLGVYCDAVAALPEVCRRVFLLRRVHGLKQKEIAETLGISLRTVEIHLQKGVMKCRAYIKETQEAEAQEGRAQQGKAPSKGKWRDRMLPKGGREQ